MHEETTLDPRVRRTREALIEALLDLAAERDFNEIGVSEIARLAGVSRAAFYLHYKDKHELVVAALESLFRELTSVESRIDDPAVMDPFHAPTGLVALLRHIQSRPELYRRLLDDSGSSAFVARLREHFTEQNLKAWEMHQIQIAPDARPPALRAAAGSGAGVSGIRWWLEHGQDVPVAQMAEWLWEQAVGVFGFKDHEIPAEIRAILNADRGSTPAG